MCPSFPHSHHWSLRLYDNDKMKSRFPSPLEMVCGMASPTAFVEEDRKKQGPGLSEHHVRTPTIMVIYEGK